MTKHKQDTHLKKIKELKEGWQRTQADFDNFKKRTETEKIESLNLAKADFISKITPVLDNFERAFVHLPKKSDPKFTQGFKQIQKQLQDLLEAEGLQKIPALKGTKFDPNIHEAISYEENEVPEDHIISELQSGWLFANKVIKASKVRVSKGK